MLSNLSKEHGAALVRFLARRLKNPHEAEDIAQAALLRIQRLNNSEVLENPKAYLFQVASNLAVDNLRRREIQRQYLQQESLVADQQIRGQQECQLSPERVVAAQEQLQRIYQTIDNLPLKCRQAFILHRKNGMSYTEIADEMGVSISSVEKYILQALRRCREALADDGD